MAKTVRMLIPSDPGGEKAIFVGVNGKGYRLQCGEMADVPEEVAEVLANSAAAAKAVEKFVEGGFREPGANKI